MLDRHEILPNTTSVIYFATTVLLALAAYHKWTSILITGWCVLNVLIAHHINFHIYEAS